MPICPTSFSKPIQQGENVAVFWLVHGTRYTRVRAKVKGEAK